ncbi:hypothetical protein [Actinophytocola sp. NPDC049390]|uniref:hypothetical protein n=1 Tax=Actinophytocola sp. NPDC049390 TaxID=3363894 RepID=UPI003796C782
MDDRIPPLSYAPDGLYEADIDALLAEYFAADETSGLPSAVTDHVATNRHVRRLNRQTVNAVLRGQSNHTDDAAA